MNKTFTQELNDIISSHVDSEGRLGGDMIPEILSLIKKRDKLVIGEDEKEGKHDRHENDAYSWCYDCQESIEEGEITTCTDRNILRLEQRKRAEEL